MPNYIQNILEIEGHKSHLESMLAHIKTDEGIFDFNKIIAIPNELVGVSFPVRIVTQKEYNKIRRINGTCGYITKEMSLDYIQRFGSNNWYDWKTENWGSKWGALEASISEIDELGNDIQRVTINFCTAWSSGFVAIMNLAGQFTTLKFFLTYADEDTGCNTGQFWVSNGSITKRNLPEDNSNESMEIYFTCWGDEGWEFVNNSWRLIGEADIDDE